MKTHLFYKVFATYVIIVALAMGIVGFLANSQIKSKLTMRIEREIMSYTETLGLISTMPEVEREVSTLARFTNCRVTLIDANGVVLADSEAIPAEMDNHLNRTEIQEARIKGKGTAVRYSKTLGINTLYTAIPVRNEYGITGYIRLARPLMEIRQSVNALFILILQSFLLVGAVSFLIAFIFTSRLVSPVQEMELYTKRLREEDVSQSLLIHANDERGRLAENINYLVSELRDKIRIANEEKKKLEAAFASMNDGVLILDRENRIEALNSAFNTIFGTRYRDIIGRTPIEAFRNIELQHAIEEFKATQSPISTEITLGMEDQVILDVNISPVLDLEKTLIVLHDVTRVKKLEKMRADFVANVTHEIKTPLSAILGFVETLQDGAIDDPQTAQKFLSTIHRHGERLNRLVDDLLTISDIELGEMKLDIEKISLASVICSVMPIAESKAAEKNINIQKDVPDNIPPVAADRDRLAQIILNLLDNAVKFTPEAGTVSLRAASSEEEKQVTISIEDTGIGIPKEDIPRLGERFYRVDKTRSRDLGGTGLGLSIVKHLIKALGGSMEITSELGRGTTVSLTLPLSVDAECADNG